MLDEIITVSPEEQIDEQPMPDIFAEEKSPLLDQEDKLDDVFVGRGDNKITVQDIKKKIHELSKTIDLSDITKPDCENKYIHTRSICTAYIVFILISLIGLIGIFIWKYIRGGKLKDRKKRDDLNDATEA
jgi:hypothetical protein